MTNGDKIREMSDEELAEFLVYGFDVIYRDEICKMECNIGDKCEDCVLIWLQKECDINER